MVNGKQYGIAPATAARVMAIVDELGFRTDSNAASVRGKRRQLIGLIMPSHPGPEFLAVADRLQNELQDAGLPLVLCRVVSGAVDLSDAPFFDLLLDGRIDAMVATSDFADDPALIDAARTGRVVIALDRETAHPGMICTPASRATAAILSNLGIKPTE